MPRVTLDNAEDNLTYFCGWVQATRKKEEIKLEDIAEYLGISAGAVSRKIRGIDAWSLRQAFQIYELFGEEFKYR